MHNCRICGSHEKLQYLDIRERQLNRGEMFQYMYCPRCKTLQLDTPVKDMSRYYEGYYSFGMKNRRMKLPKFMVKPVLGLVMKDMWKNVYPNRLVNRLAHTSLSIFNSGAQFTDRVLDVGGGNGILASFLKKNGFEDVTCIDLYADTPAYDNINFRKCTVMDIDDCEKYDLILMNWAFEHMDNPHEVLGKVKTILSRKGLCLIKIPVLGNEAWNRYRENWTGIDAPRHYFLYSPHTVEWMCGEHGLKVHKVLFHSDYDFLFLSKMYQCSSLSLSDIHQEFQKLPGKKKRWYRKLSKSLDDKKQGDTAWFYIRHTQGG